MKRIKIVDLDGAQVAYRTPGGDLELVDAVLIDRLKVDSVASLRDLNEAEGLAVQGRHAQAVVHYRRALRLARSFWVPLIRARMIRSSLAAGQVDTVVDHFIKLLSDDFDGAPLAAELLPQGFPTGSMGGSSRALKHIENVLNDFDSQSARVLLELLRYTIVARTDWQRAGGLARSLVQQPIPPHVASRAAYRVKADAMMHELSAGRVAEVLGEVDRALATAPYGVLPELLLVKAKGLMQAASEPPDFVRAGWAAMRIVLHYPDDARTPEALFVAARVHDRIGRIPTALSLLNECTQHAAVSADVRSQAEAEIRRLRRAG